MNATVRYLGRRSGLPQWRNFWTPWPLTLVDRGRMIHCSGEVVAEDSGTGEPTVLVKVCPND